MVDEILVGNQLRGRSVSTVCLLGRVQEVRLSSECDCPLREGGIGADSNPEFGTPDDDLLPDIAVEHAGAIFIPCRRPFRRSVGTPFLSNLP
jgi:hypothetical protein